MDSHKRMRFSLLAIIGGAVAVILWTGGLRGGLRGGGVPAPQEIELTDAPETESRSETSRYKRLYEDLVY